MLLGFKKKKKSISTTTGRMKQKESNTDTVSLLLDAFVWGGIISLISHRMTKDAVGFLKGH